MLMTQFYNDKIRLMLTAMDFREQSRADFKSLKVILRHFETSGKNGKQWLPGRESRDSLWKMACSEVKYVRFVVPV